MHHNLTEISYLYVHCKVYIYIYIYIRCRRLNAKLCSVVVVYLNKLLAAGLSPSIQLIYRLISGQTKATDS